MTSATTTRMTDEQYWSLYYHNPPAVIVGKLNIVWTAMGTMISASPDVTDMIAP